MARSKLYQSKFHQPAKHFFNFSSVVNMQSIIIPITFVIALLAFCQEISASVINIYGPRSTKRHYSKLFIYQNNQWEDAIKRTIGGNARVLFDPQNQPVFITEKESGLHLVRLNHPQHDCKITKFTEKPIDFYDGAIDGTGIIYIAVVEARNIYVMRYKDNKGKNIFHKKNELAVSPQIACANDGAVYFAYDPGVLKPIASYRYSDNKFTSLKADNRSVEDLKALWVDLNGIPSYLLYSNSKENLFIESYINDTWKLSPPVWFSSALRLYDYRVLKDNSFVYSAFSQSREVIDNWSNKTALVNHIITRSYCNETWQAPAVAEPSSNSGYPVSSAIDSLGNLYIALLQTEYKYHLNNTATYTVAFQIFKEGKLVPFGNEIPLGDGVLNPGIELIIDKNDTLYALISYLA